MIAAGVREILSITGISEGGQMAGGETRVSDASALHDAISRGVTQGVACLLRACEAFLIGSGKSSLPLGRRLAGYALAAAAAPLLTLALASLGHAVLIAGPITRRFWA